MLGWGLAGLVLFTRPDRSQNRRLALLLVITSSIPGTIYGLRLSATSPAIFHATMAIFVLCVLAVPAIYLLFLATLDTPLVRPLATRSGTASIIALGAISLGAWFLIPERFVADVYVAANDQILWRFGDLFLTAATLPEMVVLLFGAIVAVSVYRRAQTRPVRQQARWYAIAFVTRDILLPGYLLIDNFAALPDGFRSTYNPIIYPGIDIAFILLLGYGILQTQLFAIDLRIKQTVRHGSVAAIVVGAYVTVSLLGEFYLGGTAGTVLGIGATGLLILAIVPLQGLGSRLADAAMPHVHDAPAYLEARKLEVYQAALEEALGSTGEIDERAARALDRLRVRLGLTPRDHAVLLHALTVDTPSPGSLELEPRAIVLDRYRLVRHLGEGGQGTTWLASDTHLRRDVVLKVLRAGGSSEAILREAEAMAAVDHPNVVTLYDVEAVSGQVVLVMEHIDQGTLQDRLDDGPLDDETLTRLATDLLAGLEALHRAGIVHRDVKPSNILVSSDGRYRLADLGVAQLPGAQHTTDGLGGSREAVGTARYMSPEQARGERVGERSDLFSAAATLYEAATGSPLFEPRDGESAMAARMRVASWAGLTDALEDRPTWAPWLSRALARSPADRFESAAEMLAALPEPPASSGQPAYGSA